MKKSTDHILQGIVLAIVATIIWSGNFIVARKVIQDIQPITLAFFRWLTATVILFPFAFRQLREDWPTVKKHWPYFAVTAFSGIALFNTFIYVAGHYSPAINLALIGTTSSPIMAIALAAVFLHEKIPPARIAGLAVCIIGILLLLSGGSLEKLYHFQFGKGDVYILLGALAFAVYNTLVKRKPAGIRSMAFLLLVFGWGAAMLFPGYLWERAHAAAVVWTPSLWVVLLYLGVGTSVVSYLCWNAAIARLGTARTALFGNLIPLFASLEALWLLREKITLLHIVSSLIIVAGLVLANLPSKKP